MTIITTDKDKMVAIRELEMAINVALISWGFENERLRYTLLNARGDIREALGEARS
jgi:hypothetical protein